MTYYLYLLNSWYLPTNFEITVTSGDSHEMKAFKPPASELLDSIAIQKTGCRDWQGTWVSYSGEWQSWDKKYQDPLSVGDA
jgi:hypothetical protein